MGLLYPEVLQVPRGAGVGETSAAMDRHLTVFGPHLDGHIAFLEARDPANRGILHDLGPAFACSVEHRIIEGRSLDIESLWTVRQERLFEMKMPRIPARHGPDVA